MNDVLSMLEEEGHDFTRDSIFTVPPDNDLSDGDSDDEDEGGDLNRMAPRMLQTEINVTLESSSGTKSTALEDGQIIMVNFYYFE